MNSPRSLTHLFSLALVIVCISPGLRHIDSDEPKQIGVALLIDHSGLAKSSNAALDQVQRALSRIGFKTESISELDRKGTLEKVSQFSSRIPTNSLAVVYYLGPVLEGHQKIKSKYFPAAFLCCRGLEIERKRDTVKQCVSLTEIDDLVSSSGCRHSLFLIDQLPMDPGKVPGVGALENSEIKKIQTIKNLGQFSGSGSLVIGIRQEFESYAKLIAESDAADWGPMLKGASIQQRPLSDPTSEKTRIEATQSHRDQMRPSLERLSLESLTSNFVVDKVRQGTEPGEVFVNSIGQVFCWVPAGKFTMGSPKTEAYRNFDEKKQDIDISTGFWISKYEVTEREYFRATKRKSKFPRGGNFPHVYAGSGDASRFADSMNKLETKKLGEWKYSIPSESQWEYACRAGGKQSFSFGDDYRELYRFGNFADRTLFDFNPSEYRYADQTQNDGFSHAAPVGSFLPNRWGVHDMHGNVWEWCRDRYRQDFAAKITKENEKPFNDLGRVIRGGSWLSHFHYCRSAMRNAQTDLKNSPHIGIRVIIVPK